MHFSQLSVDNGVVYRPGDMETAGGIISCEGAGGLTSTTASSHGFDSAISVDDSGASRFSSGSVVDSFIAFRII